MKFLIDIITYFFIEVIFQNMILGIFKLIRTIGLIILKYLTFSKISLPEIRERYKDSSKPYFLGFGIVIGIIIFIAKIMR